MKQGRKTKLNKRRKGEDRNKKENMTQEIIEIKVREKNKFFTISSHPSFLCPSFSQSYTSPPSLSLSSSTFLSLLPISCPYNLHEAPQFIPYGCLPHLPSSAQPLLFMIHSKKRAGNSERPRGSKKRLHK